MSSPQNYYSLHREEIILKRRAWRVSHREQVRQQQQNCYNNKREKREQLKVEVLTYYGKGQLVCVHCGFNTVQALTLDHIQPLGSKVKRPTGINFYNRLKQQGYPEGYQTLCANCQMIKMFKGEEWTVNRLK
uniref:Uncharacterized protein n=1 Tax=viral metagenome TaxID=1070528 RepID=A0A6M3IPK7_9ZZZZ